MITVMTAPLGWEAARVYTSDTLVEQVPLRSTMTPAARLGSIPEWVLMALAVLAVAMTTRRRIFGPTPVVRELGDDGEMVVARSSIVTVRPPR
jgi:hypothetical protein